MPPESMRTCIDNCLACHRACIEQWNQCIHLGGPHAAPSHLTLVIDCAEICHLSSEFMLRGSPQHHLTCRACAEICERCAVDCERLGHHDCAFTCRACAATCQEMAAASIAA